MLPAQQHSQPHGQLSASEEKQLLRAIATIPERLEGLIQLRKNHYFPPPPEMFLILVRVRGRVK